MRTLPHEIHRLTRRVPRLRRDRHPGDSRGRPRGKDNSKARASEDAFAEGREAPLAAKADAKANSATRDGPPLRPAQAARASCRHTEARAPREAARPTVPELHAAVVAARRSSAEGPKTSPALKTVKTFPSARGAPAARLVLTGKGGSFSTGGRFALTQTTLRRIVGDDARYAGRTAQFIVERDGTGGWRVLPPPRRAEEPDIPQRRAIGRPHAPRPGRHALHRSRQGTLHDFTRVTQTDCRKSGTPCLPRRCSARAVCGRGCTIGPSARSADLCDGFTRSP